MSKIRIKINMFGACRLENNSYMKGDIKKL